MATKIPFYIVVLCIVTLLQVFGLSHLTVFDVSPDAISLFLAFVSVTVGQRAGTSFGFAAGIITGLLSGNMGLSMLARTVEGFIAGYFNIPENSHATSKQKTKRLYWAVMTATFFANAIFAAGYNPLGLSPLYRILVLGLLESLLTLILAFVAHWLLMRKTFSD
ncbi:rod shape-determining protein MreD [Chlorobium sp. BLA1]|uniref:rod shape-determining protein MreD n=1 Tax=Candidatus Chlorobium masyuteum TaxID=2716876 RepID=UPI0014248E34|nr:rod shape-determining protein MreD [Candidatus Chlorobium masyuteum]NHQ60676.1 rod shape-determining protein MreD [Candidatus Chlorobium masyuteum]